MDLTINDAGIEETPFKETNAKVEIKTVEEILNKTDSSSETIEPNVVKEKILNYFPSAIITLSVILLIFVFIHHPI